MRVGFEFYGVIDEWPNQLTDIMRRHMYYGDKVFVISVVGKGNEGITSERLYALTPYVDMFCEVALLPGAKKSESVLQQAKLTKLNLFYSADTETSQALVNEGILCFPVPRM